MNLGFEVVAARSKKTDANDDLAFEPMRQRARKEPRKQPSTDEKKVKRRLTKSAVAWSRRDSLDHDTEFVRYVLLSDTEALEASVIRDETMDEPTWAWLVSVIDRQDGGILEFVMSGSASGLGEAKGKADVALDRAEMDMMFERVGSRKQAASDHQETIWHLTGYLMGYNGDAQPDDNAPFALMVGYAAGADDLADGKPSNYTRADLDYVTEEEYMTSDDVADFFEKRGSHKQASENYYVFDEWADDTGWAERPLAGPFASAEEASAVLKDVAYPFQFPYGPETVVGDLFVATELNQMDPEDFINQTLSSRRVAWTSEYADVADDEALVMFEEVGHRFHPERGFGGENWQEDRERVIQSITETLLTSPYRERLAEFTQRHADYLEDINFHTLNEAVERAKNTLGQKMSNRRKHAGYRYQPDTQSSFDVNRYDESPGEPFTNPSGHTYSGPEKAEATGESYVGSRSSSMQREADILEAMRLASLTEQRQLMAELNTIRANRTAARQADRDIDLTAAVIEDRLTPVLTKSMHTVATDWLTEVPTPDGDGDGTAREMVAQASVWFKRLSSEVVADRDEFAEQARGKARQLTSSLGVGREAAIASFLDAAAHLRSKRAARPDLEMGEDDYLEDAVERAAQRAMGTGEDSWLEEAYEDRFAFDDNDMDVEGRRKRAKKSAANEPTYALWHRTHDQMWVIQDASASDYRVMVIQQIGTGKYFWEIFSVSTGVIMDEGEANSLADAQVNAERAFQPLKSAGASKKVNKTAAKWEQVDDMTWTIPDASASRLKVTIGTDTFTERYFWDIVDVDTRTVIDEGEEETLMNAQVKAELAFRSIRSASKQANELMGYGEGEYVTNAGDDMMMDDMSGVDMDPRYETNASRKRAGSQYIVRGWFGDEAIGDNEPDVEFVANSMERAEEESEYYDVLGYQTTIQELSWKDASRKHAEWDQSAFDAWMKQVDSKMVGMSGLGASDLPDQPYADWFEDGMSASEAAKLSLSDTADEMGFGGLFGSRKQAALSVQHLIDALNPPEHAGFGYADAVRTIEGMSSSFSVDDVHGAVVEAANNLHLTRDELAMWTNSKWARWLGDALTFLSDRPGYGEDLKAEVRKHLNMSIINELASQLSEEDSDRIYGVASSRKQAMPQKYEIDAYTADELTGGARSRARQDWDVMQWDLYVADDLSEYLNWELARQLPSFAGTKVVWDVGFSQGDGVWLDRGPLSREQVRDLGVDLPQGVSLEVVDGGAGGVNLEADYPLGIDIEEKFEIEDLRNAAETALNGVLYDLYQMARAYVMDAGSEESWIDWADENEVLYDQSGRIIRQGSRKQAMPSDDLIDVDIEDYMGGDEGPDPDSQSGHAETALPYAGDDTTPAFRETGWTSKRRTSAMSDDDWDDDSREEVDTEDMLRFLQEEPQYLPEIAGMTWQGMRDWYARKYDYFADVWGLAIDPDTIDWEFISENMPKTGKRKRRANRKTSADMSSLEMYDSYYEQVADSVAGAKVDPSGSGVIVGGVSYKVMRNRDSGSVYLQASNGRTLSLDNAQVDSRVGMPFYGDVADAVEHMARNASRKRGSASSKGRNRR